MTQQNQTTPDQQETTTPDRGAAASLAASLAEDAAAAFAGDDQQAQEAAQQAETDGAQPFIRRVDDQGQETRFAILTKEQFTDLFCFAFDAPQQLHSAFRHIATDNGQLYRAEASRATASRIYDLCRTSGIRWLESLLALDQSGLEKVVELALVGWFAIGTLQGAGAAMQELRNGPQDAQGQGAGGVDGQTGGTGTQNRPEAATGGADGVPDWARKQAEGAA